MERNMMKLYRTVRRSLWIGAVVVLLLAGLVGRPVSADRSSRSAGRPFGLVAGDRVAAATLAHGDGQAGVAQARTISYTYDRAGRLRSANYGEGALLVYTYDAAGNLIRLTDHFGIWLPLLLRAW